MSKYQQAKIFRKFFIEKSVRASNMFFWKYECMNLFVVTL